jgi:hypothetical protein
LRLGIHHSQVSKVLQENGLRYPEPPKRVRPEMLIEHYRCSKNYQEAAKTAGVNRETMAKAVQAAGLNKGKPWNIGTSTVPRSLVAEHYKSGKTAKEISKILGMGLSTVYRSLRQEGIKADHKGLKGANHPQWNGGSYDQNKSKNWNSSKKARVLFAILIGRELTEDEVVHHHDEDPSNNDPSNLWLFPNTGSHSAYHCALRDYRRKGLIESSIPSEKAFCAVPLLELASQNGVSPDKDSLDPLQMQV